eukprot:2012340-Prymnesium_polylepis.1
MTHRIVQRRAAPTVLRRMIGAGLAHQILDDRQPALGRCQVDCGPLVIVAGVWLTAGGDDHAQLFDVIAVRRITECVRRHVDLIRLAGGRFGTLRLEVVDDLCAGVALRIVQRSATPPILRRVVRPRLFQQELDDLQQSLGCCQVNRSSFVIVALVCVASAQDDLAQDFDVVACRRIAECDRRHVDLTRLSRARLGPFRFEIIYHRRMVMALRIVQRSAAPSIRRRVGRARLFHQELDHLKQSLRRCQVNRGSFVIVAQICITTGADNLAELFDIAARGSIAKSSRRQLELILHILLFNKRREFVFHLGQR